MKAARLNAESHEVLVRARTKLEDPPQQESEEYLAVLESAEWWQSGDNVKDHHVVADGSGAVGKVASKPTNRTVKPKAANSSKKPAQRAKSAG